ncbi:MAG: HU family DNA-binding protein [Oligoflexales bacterium]
MAAKKKNKATGKSTTKKSTPKTTAAPKKAKAGFDSVKKARTKSQILAALADNTGITKKEVDTIFAVLGDLIANDLAKGPGMFTVPGLMKVVVIKKPATKARKGTNPFTGEEMMFKAKPARNVVKVRPLKGLKDMV